MRAGENRSSAASRALTRERVPPGPIFDQLRESSGQRLGVSRRVAHRRHPVVEQLRRAAAAGRDHRPLRRHPFGDDHAEGLGRGARVHDDVERTQRRGHVVGLPGQSNDSGQPALVHLRFELAARPLAAGGLVERAADDVGAHRESAGEALHRVEKHLVSLPAGEGRHQANPYQTVVGRQATELGQRQARTVGRERVSVDRVVDADERRRRPERGARVRQHAFGVRDDRVGAPRQRAQQTHRQAAAAHVVVQVPDETHPRGLDQRRGDVSLEAVGVHDGRVGATEYRSQSPQIPRQR